MAAARVAMVWAVAAIACDHRSRIGPPSPGHAVGTYIGGGSIMMGPSDCTITGTPGVFDTESPAPGPRFVRAAGVITTTCPRADLRDDAVIPTGAHIMGDDHVTLGGEPARLYASLVAGDRDLDGEAAIEWTLGTDCTNVAQFGPVLGSQDTGGPARSRTLAGVAKGTCTVGVTLTTGTSLDAAFRPATFHAETHISIQ